METGTSGQNKINNYYNNKCGAVFMEEFKIIQEP